LGLQACVGWTGVAPSPSWRCRVFDPLGPVAVAHRQDDHDGYEVHHDQRHKKPSADLAHDVRSIGSQNHRGKPLARVHSTSRSRLRRRAGVHGPPGRPCGPSWRPQRLTRFALVPDWVGALRRADLHPFDNFPLTEYSGSVRGVRLLIVSTLCSLVVVAVPWAAESSVPRCLGRDATMVGTKRADLLIGTPGNDVIVGLGGDDRIVGRAGDDRICGGDGSDHIDGGGRHDALAGEGGSDILFGGRGDDLLRGGPGADTMNGERGRDFIDYPAVTLSGSDTLASLEAAGPQSPRVGAGDDREIGGEGGDILQGRGNDLLRGGAGNDIIEQIGSGSSVLLGGPRNDQIAVYGDTRSVTLIGGDGVDHLLAGDGNDALHGGRGRDRLDGGEGNDSLDGGIDFDFASFGNPFIFTRPVQADLATGIAMGWGTDTLSDIEGLFGTAGDDVLTGDGERNVLYGMFGNDVLAGGLGRDLASFRYSGLEAGGAVTVDLGAGTANGEGSDALTGIEDVTGTVFADTLIGEASPNRLSGGFGNDTLSGLDGDDVLNGGKGKDTGDGGNQVTGDVCISIETPMNCESTS
jgi:Ca2+-binding RTX toxin-like protein